MIIIRNLEIGAAHRILENVGDVADGKAADPQLLLEDLNSDLLRYRGYVQLDGKPRFQAYDRLKQMDAALRRANLKMSEDVNTHFLEMLASAARATNSQPGAASGTLSNAYAIMEPDDQVVSESLETSLSHSSEIAFSTGAEEAVIAALASLATLQVWTRHAADVTPRRTRIPPISHLVGAILPETFTKHFGRDFAIRRSGAYPAGPDIRFCLSVLAEAEILSARGAPYSARSVEKYWKLMNRNELRRNSRETSSTVIPNSV